jgi:hypothetical protein
LKFQSVRSSTPGLFGVRCGPFGKSVSQVCAPPIDADHRLLYRLLTDSSNVFAREYWSVFITTVPDDPAWAVGMPNMVMTLSSAVPARPSGRRPRG